MGAVVPGFCTVRDMSFFPDDLSPTAAAHLGNLQSVLRSLVSERSTVPPHHVDMDGFSYESALAWARATAAESAGSDSPAPNDPASEQLFVSTMSLAPLDYQEFAFYVGLLEDALTVDAAWSRDFLLDVENRVRDSSSRFDFKDDLGESGTPTTPAAVLLLMYLRFHSMVSAATNYLQVADICDRCAATLSVVLSTTRPARV